MASVRRFSRVTGRGCASPRAPPCGLRRGMVGNVVLAHGQFLRVPPETPSVRSIRTTSPLSPAQAQFGRANSRSTM